MTAPSKRRWFRFSLRTKFVLVTLCAVWLGWQRYIVRERKAILEQLAQLGKTSDDGYFEVIVGNKLDDDPKRVPLIRQWLGDETVKQLVLSPAPEPQLMTRTKNAFPEAEILIGRPWNSIVVH